MITYKCAAILIGIFLDDLLSGQSSCPRLNILSALVILIVVTNDLVKQPAHWVWLYTYLYSKEWARGVPEGSGILAYGLIFGCGLLLLGVSKLRRAMVWSLFCIVVFWGGYLLNSYQVVCAHQWSQKQVIQTYYRTRQKATEPLVAWNLNWRGETWYTAAQIVVSMNNNSAITQWLSQRGHGRVFFITERGNFGALKGIIPSQKGRDTLRIIDNSNAAYHSRTLSPFTSASPIRISSHTLGRVLFPLPPAECWQQSIAPRK